MAATFKRDEETARLAREPASPTKALREALGSTHLHTPQQYRIASPSYATAQPTRTPQNPFANTGGHGNLFPATRGNLFPHHGVGPGALGMGQGMLRPQIPHVEPLRNRPAAIRHQDLLQFVLPHHPNTPEGRVAYQAQITAWHTANPNGKPDEQHPYLLTPGSPAVGSRECWDCGEKGHMQAAPVCVGAVLPPPERDWRRIAGFIAHAFHLEHLTATQAVNFIGTQHYMPYDQYNQQSYPGGAYLGEVDSGQGNGGGLSN